MVAPLASRTVEFKRGISKGLIPEMPVGGQTPPISTLGLREEWKKAQKKAKKKNTSEQMKSTIPIRNPFCTFSVCAPTRDSRMTSVHQKSILKPISTRPSSANQTSL